MTDATDRRLLVAKVQYFTYFAAGVFLMPFLNLYFKRLGLTASQIGLLAALRPWVSQPCATLWAALADRTGSHRGVLLLTFVASTLTRCALAVPPATLHFGALLAVVVVTEVLQGPVTVLVDAATLATVRKDRDYGRQRLWGTLGWGCFSPLAGWVVQRFSGPHDVHSAFAAYALVSALCLFPTAAIDFGPLHAKKRGGSGKAGGSSAEGQHDGDAAARGTDNDDATQPLLLAAAEAGAALDGAAPALDATAAEVADAEVAGGAGAAGGGQVHGDAAGEGGAGDRAQLAALLTDPQAWAFFLTAVTMGYGIGSTEVYLFIFLADLGAAPLLMGVDLAVTCGAEAPVFLFSSAIFRRLGVTTALHLVLAGYIVRLAYYTLLPSLPSPWLVLPIETLHGLTFALGWQAGTMQASRLAPPGMRATMQGVFAALFAGVGYGLAGLVGGVVYHNHGGRALYVMACGVVAAGWAGVAVLQAAAAWSTRQR